MRDYSVETEKRVDFIRGLLDDSGVGGIVFGNSGGKDSALVGILCKLACENTVGLIMPCGTESNYREDASDAKALAGQYGIEARTVELGAVAEELKRAIGASASVTPSAAANIAPRLRMAALYATAASEGRLVAGTSNRSEIYMGYYTKWGDGACDFNPIADLAVAEVLEYLAYLGAPRSIIEKAPSGGLFDGQTDEREIGVSYRSIDGFLLTGHCPAEDLAIIDRFHAASGHKRRAPPAYGVQK